MRIVVLLFICLTLAACAGFSGKDIETVEPLATRFTEAMRWQDYPGAARFLAAEHREAFLAQFRNDQDLHVVDSQVLGLDYDDQSEQVAANFVLDYYLLPSTRIQRWIWTQQWQQQPGRFSNQANWLIINRPPPFPDQ